MMKSIGPRTDPCGTTDDVNKIRAFAATTDMLFSTVQVRAKPRQCCVVNTKGDSQPLQQNSRLGGSWGGSCSRYKNSSKLTNSSHTSCRNIFRVIHDVQIYVKYILNAGIILWLEVMQTSHISEGKRM